MLEKLREEAKQKKQRPPDENDMFRLWSVIEVKKFTTNIVNKRYVLILNEPFNVIYKELENRIGNPIEY